MQRIKNMMLGKDKLTETELKKIDYQLLDFESKRAALNSCDSKMLAAMAGDTLLWLSGWLGSWGKYVCVPGYVALYYGFEKSCHRAELNTQFHKALTELYKTYLECVKAHTPAVTAEESFLKLLLTLSDYATDMNDLKGWEVTNDNINMFAQEYHAIFADRAQRLSFDRSAFSPDVQPSPETFGSLLEAVGIKKGIPEVVKVLEPERFIGNSWFQFFKTSYEGARMQVRGHDFHPVKEVLQP